MTAEVAASDRFISLSPAAGTTALSYDFPLAAEDALTVVLVRAGADATLVLDTDYSFDSGLGDGSGGTITLAAASLDGDAYCLVGLEPIARDSGFLGSQKFSSDKFNADLDKLTRIGQEARRDIDRSWKSDWGGSGRTIATIAEGHFPKADADGNLVDGGDADDIINAETNAATATAQAAIATTQAGIATAAATSITKDVPGGVQGFSQDLKDIGDAAALAAPRTVLIIDVNGDKQFFPRTTRIATEWAANNGTGDQHDNIMAAMADAGVNPLVFPTGVYRSSPVLVDVGYKMHLVGQGGRGQAYISGISTTASVLTINESYVRLDNLGLFGESPPTSDNAALSLIGGSDIVGRDGVLGNCYYGIKGIGGGGDSVYDDMKIASAFAAGMYLKNFQGMWSRRLKADPTWQVTFTALKSWAATTAFVAGDVVVTGGYILQAIAGGTSGSSAPVTVAAWTNIADGSDGLTWFPCCTANYAALLLDTGAANNHWSTGDFTGGPLAYSVRMINSDAGTAPYHNTWDSHCEFGGAIDVGFDAEAAGAWNKINMCHIDNGIGAASIGLYLDAITGLNVAQTTITGWKTGVQMTQNAAGIQIGQNTIGSSVASSVGILVNDGAQDFDISHNIIGVAGAAIDLETGGATNNFKVVANSTRNSGSGVTDATDSGANKYLAGNS